MARYSGFPITLPVQTPLIRHTLPVSAAKIAGFFPTVRHKGQSIPPFVVFLFLFMVQRTERLRCGVPTSQDGGCFDF